MNQKTSNYTDPVSALRDAADDVRINKKLAQEWLMDPPYIIHKGIVRHLQMRAIGLGVYHVKLKPEGWHGTHLVKSFETRTYDAYQKSL